MANNPTLEHRHYKLIANAISKAEKPEYIVPHLIQLFARDNNNFNFDRFKRACAGQPDGRDK